ncbi:glucose PTS transporter subunit IIA [Clostridium sp. Marseille-Q2269]|uniref:glucose PTS transporter subunit IIA n=1 Tax=Clostridium sp. Marseille-Q2269 TaxID=2942205 RepID=UPI0020730522|nr:glucose PTS transporter subunit IIA [Clostridium sp. Marseille-Q2269]
MKNVLTILQKIGKSLMLPVSVLPAAALLLRLGYPDLLNNLYMLKAGDAIFSNLPLIFAIGVAIGISDGEGIAALAAVVGQLILQGILNVGSSKAAKEVASRIAADRNMTLQSFMNTKYYEEVLRNTNIDLGVFGGIVIGIIAAIIYNKYKNIKLPNTIGFFGGKRFVLIFTAIISFAFGMMNLVIWPEIQKNIDTFARFATTSPLGPAFYAAGKRLLIPLGLHHMYYPPFLYQFGNYVDPSGVKYFGDFSRYFHGDPTAGVFMASEFPILMFGLPGAAIAMIFAAKKENRRKTCSIMLSAALVSFLTGITEPIEFAFIFVAPMLFVFHVVAAFTSGIITSIFNIRLGYTFSASFIDYVLGYKFSHNGILIFPIGLFYFFIYFIVFNYVINKRDIKTLGRDGIILKENKEIKSNEKAAMILQALGGEKNIKNLDCCITRLRIALNNEKKLDRTYLEKINLPGLVQTGSVVQIILGTEAENIKYNIEQIIKNGVNPKQVIEYERALKLINPIDGEILPLEQVPDEVFSERLLGDGFAIRPCKNKVYAPIDGTIKFLFPSNHAIVIENEEGIEILLHIGIDTVDLNGKGFKAYIEEKQKVKKGELLLSYDKDFLEREAKSLISPIIITNLNENGEIKIEYGYKKEKEIVAYIKN